MGRESRKEGIYAYTWASLVAQMVSDGKESTYNEGERGLIPGLGISSGEGHGNPLQYTCLENPHGQRSLAGCIPWDRKDSNTTEGLITQA